MEVTATSVGREQLEDIAKAWHALYERYSEILGMKQGKKLTDDTYEAFRKLIGEV